MTIVSVHPVVRTLKFAVILGGLSAVWGWWVLSGVDLSGWRYGGAESRPGIVEYCERTRHRVGGIASSRGGTGSGTPIFRHHFSFGDSTDGARRRGVSYRTGACVVQGSPVRVEYPQGRPALARIEGQRAKPYSAWFGFLLLAPLAGLAFAAWAARQALAKSRLARSLDRTVA